MQEISLMQKVSLIPTCEGISLNRSQGPIPGEGLVSQQFSKLLKEVQCITRVQKQQQRLTNNQEIVSDRI